MCGGAPFFFVGGRVFVCHIVLEVSLYIGKCGKDLADLADAGEDSVFRLFPSLRQEAHDPNIHFADHPDTDRLGDIHRAAELARLRHKAFARLGVLAVVGGRELRELRRRDELANAINDLLALEIRLGCSQEQIGELAPGPPGERTQLAEVLAAQGSTRPGLRTSEGLLEQTEFLHQLGGLEPDICGQLLDVWAAWGEGEGRRGLDLLPVRLAVRCERGIAEPGHIQENLHLPALGLGVRVQCSLHQVHQPRPDLGCLVVEDAPLEPVLNRFFEPRAAGAKQVLAEAAVGPLQRRHRRAAIRLHRAEEGVGVSSAYGQQPHALQRGDEAVREVCELRVHIARLAVERRRGASNRGGV